jgi:site-specific recombinase XerC
MHVAAYIEQHPGSPQTIKQHLAAIRMLFSWLTEKGVLAMNPAWEVKTESAPKEKHSLYVYNCWCGCGAG